MFKQFIIKWCNAEQIQVPYGDYTSRITDASVSKKFV